jgi:hypothetical protein
MPAIGLVSGGKEENGPDIGANLTPSFLGNMPPFAKQIRGFHRVKARAITECFPIHAVLAIQHHFVPIGAPALALGRAKENIDHSRPGANVRMRNQHDWMLASLVREIVTPNIELVFHLDSTGPWTQPARMAS